MEATQTPECCSSSRSQAPTPPQDLVSASSPSSDLSPASCSSLPLPLPLAGVSPEVPGEHKSPFLPPVDVGGLRLSLLLKKLLHLRQAFEPPLLQVFGFPFFLRHQVSAVSCCSCCLHCCCCDVARTSSLIRVSSPPASPALRPPSSLSIPSSPCSPTPPYSSSLSSSSASSSWTSLSNPDSPGCSVVGGSPEGGASSQTSVDWSIPSCEAASPRGGRRCGHSCGERRKDGRCMQAPPLLAGPRGFEPSESQGTETGDRVRSASLPPGAREQTRKPRKRRRLVSDSDDGEAVGEKNLQSQEEREIEILLARNILRQIRLPGVSQGPFVLFFTSDWTHFVQRCVANAQQRAMEQQRERGDAVKQRRKAGINCPCSETGLSSSVSRKEGESTEEKHFAERRSGRSAHGDAKESCCAVDEEESESQEEAAGKQERNSLSEAVEQISGWEGRTRDCRVGPATVGSGEATEDASPGSACPNISRRRKFLLDLPWHLGKQLATVLCVELLSRSPHTDLCVDAVREAMKKYLTAWSSRRREAGFLLKVASRKHGEILASLSESRLPGQRSSRTVVERHERSRGEELSLDGRWGAAGMSTGDHERTLHGLDTTRPDVFTQAKVEDGRARKLHALERIKDMLRRGVKSAEEVLTLREAHALGLRRRENAAGDTFCRRVSQGVHSTDMFGGTAREDGRVHTPTQERVRNEENKNTEEAICEARVYTLIRLLMGTTDDATISAQQPFECTDTSMERTDFTQNSGVHGVSGIKVTAPFSRGDKARDARGASSEAFSSLIPRAQQHPSRLPYTGKLVSESTDELLLLLHELNLLHSAPGASQSRVSLCLPQQGLFVRWLTAGRNEVLTRLHARKFKEMPWRDVERRGLLRSGLGSRFVLLDVKGKKDVEAVEITSGLVVRIPGALHRGMRVYENVD
uniref:Serine-threonine protein kinase 19 n=1 Tax=Toxoplasma gondii COUG TaxID=1074873 RepID=A0A2G8Y3H1_TOXGO|nr:serine-threonine protein kinase 19 [Toxoplasma gondii COUG]